jgi:hypothetical protein
MSQQPPPPYERIPSDHLGMFIAAALMGVAAWLGLYGLIFYNPPHIGGQLWLFFVLLSIAVSCTVLPLVRYFNVRLTPLDRDLPPSGVIIRQSVWVGLYVAVCAWLQIPRALSVAAATLLAIAFIGVEVFLRARENSSVQR